MPSSTTLPSSTQSFAGWLPAARVGVVPDDKATRRRIGLIWGLLFFNVMSYAKQALIIPIPTVLGKLLTQGALALAFILALMINRKLIVRPNVFLVLATVLAAGALMMSIRDQVSIVGSDYRAIRLIVFVSVLWLLTPWWGRKDMLLLRCQLRALTIVLGTVLLGLAIAPGKAFAFEGRLSGSIWPIPPTQVAHYAAITAGLATVLWFSGLMRRNLAALMFCGSVVILILTHTRTALIALLAGILVVGLSLFTGRRRRPQCLRDGAGRAASVRRRAPAGIDPLVRQGPEHPGDLSAHRTNRRVAGAARAPAPGGQHDLRLRAVQQLLQRAADRRQLALDLPGPRDIR